MFFQCANLKLHFHIKTIPHEAFELHSNTLRGLSVTQLKIYT